MVKSKEIAMKFCTSRARMHRPAKLSMCCERHAYLGHAEDLDRPWNEQIKTMLSLDGLQVSFDMTYHF